MKFFYFHFNF